tara:strand:- start:86 stop:1027 length:942 start_codon:yes stop_codon:yes gene_type:complete
MRLFIYNCSKFILGSFLLLHLIGLFLSDQLSKNNNQKANWILNLKNNNYDYLVIGSSRAMNMFDSNVIDDSLKTNGINLGHGGAGFRFNYLSLYLFLKRNNVKKVFIQIDPFEIYHNNIYNRPQLDNFFFNYLTDSVVLNTLSDYHSRLKLKIYNYIPILGVIEYNKAYKLSGFIESFNSSIKYDKTKGSDLLSSEKNIFVPPKNVDFGQAEIKPSRNDLKYLSKIVQLCRKNKINVYLYTAPIYDYEYYYLSKYPNFDKDIKDIVQSLDLIYYNYRDFFIIKDSMLFKDVIHLNDLGTKIFSKDFMAKVRKY